MNPRKSRKFFITFNMASKGHFWEAGAYFYTLPKCHHRASDFYFSLTFYFTAKIVYYCYPCLRGARSLENFKITRHRPRFDVPKVLKWVRPSGNFLIVRPFPIFCQKSVFLVPFDSWMGIIGRTKLLFCFFYLILLPQRWSITPRTNIRNKLL